MKFKGISDIELLVQTKSLVVDERNLTSKILEYLKEIESRSLYLERGYSSMFVFCTDFLCFEASRAQRRIVASRLLCEIPEIKEKIESGALSLTALNQANMFFNASAKCSEELSPKVTIAEKVEVLKTLENKSTRECERELIKLNPSIVPRIEKTRDLTDDLVELKVVLNREVMKKLSRVKELMSNKDPNINMAGLINELATSFLNKNDPLKKEIPKKSTNEQSALTVTPQKTKTRHIPNTIKVHVFKRDNGRCQYVDPVTNRKCNSSYQVEMDHKQPFSLGGSNSIENLTLLCKGHNIHKATKEFGVDLMKKYVPNLDGISI